MIKVLNVGDGAINFSYRAGFRAHTSPQLVSIVERKQLQQALLTDPEIEATRYGPFVVSTKFPKPDQLMDYDVLILSDVGYESFAKYPNNAIGPDRVKGIVKFVENGGGFIMCGGSYGFYGSNGRAKWWGTPVADILPVEMPMIPNGYIIGSFPLKITAPEHELMRGIPWETCPPFPGYEPLGEPKKGATVLARIGWPDEEKDIGFAEWTFGKGRVIAFSSDPVPGWGTAMCKWEHYTKFWVRLTRWLAKKTVK